MKMLGCRRLDATHIPNKQLKTYDFELAMKKHSLEEDRLIEKYEKPVMEKYGISESELEEIAVEGTEKKWSSSE
jgi:hypothetical protein